MGSIHKMAATFGDFPTARALRENFSSQRNLRICQALLSGFFFLLRAKKPHTNGNIFGSAPSSLS